MTSYWGDRLASPLNLWGQDAVKFIVSDFLQTSNSSFVMKWATWQLAGFLIRTLYLSFYCGEVQPKGHQVPKRDRASFWSLEHLRPPGAWPFCVCSPHHWQSPDEEAPGPFIIFIWLMIHVLFVTACFGTSMSKMVLRSVTLASKAYGFRLSMNLIIYSFTQHTKIHFLNSKIPLQRFTEQTHLKEG